MLFEDNCTDAELLNGDMVTVYFDFNYTAGCIGKRSGHPDTWENDEPEEYEPFNIKVESITGSLVDLSTENEAYVMPSLLNAAERIYESWAEGMRESNAEDRQDMMNIATGFMKN